MSLWWVEFWKEEDGNAGLSLPVVMPLKVLVFVSILEEEKFSGRPISLDPEMVDTLVPERWETDPTFPELPSHLFSSHSWQKVMADRWFFDDIFRLEAQALVRAPELSPTANQYTTAGYCHSVTIFQWCSASTADDRATSDS